MRLWSIHPLFLDHAGLVALWREALLAQKVLSGATGGYRNHPQLTRFKRHDDPAGAISTYLEHIYREAEHRGWNFNRAKITGGLTDRQIPVTEGQMKYEFELLKRKLKIRNFSWYKILNLVIDPKPHPLFIMVPGEVEEWEKTPV
jgi:hypothetical protein